MNRLLFALSLSIAALAGCAGKQVVETTTITPTQSPDETPFVPAEFDTPATRNCLTLGGTLTIQKGASSGTCALPGGALIDTEQLLAETRG